jgi:carbonic anhydrase/acetyltransferase-like protein (isoleucine patch superfamily)
LWFFAEEKGTLSMIETIRDHSPRIDPEAVILPGAVVVGDVTIEPAASVFFGAVLRGDVNSIRLGRGSNVQDQAVIHVSSDGYSTDVGQDVTIGHAAVVHACTVGDGSLIGIGAIVMDGAVVGPGSIIGAGALVPPGSEIPPGVLAVGQPARVRRDVTPDEAAGLLRSAQNYASLARSYRSRGMDQNA